MDSLSTTYFPRVLYKNYPKLILKDIKGESWILPRNISRRFLNSYYFLSSLTPYLSFSISRVPKCRKVVCIRFYVNSLRLTGSRLFWTGRKSVEKLTITFIVVWNLVTFNKVTYHRKWKEGKTRTTINQREINQS